MKALVEIERKLMVKENKEAEAAKEAAREAFEKAAIQHVLENFTALKDHLCADIWGHSSKVGIRFRPADNTDEEDGLPMPLHLKKLHSAWDDIDSQPNGWNVERLPERDIRKRIEDKLKRVNASAVINGTNCAQVERTPVVKEYLEEFLASLTKASKAAERLVA